MSLVKYKYAYREKIIEMQEEEKSRFLTFFPNQICEREFHCKRFKFKHIN